MKDQICPRVLFLAQLPPPMHGAAAVNLELVDSVILNRQFDIETIPIQLSDEIAQIGVHSFKKFVRILQSSCRIIRAVVRSRPKLAYMTLPPHGGGFYAALPLVFILKIMRVKILYHFHGKGFRNASIRSKVYAILVKFATRNTHSILLSPLLLDDARESIDSGEIFYLPNFAPDVSDVRDVPARNGRHVLFLSNLVLSKGPVALLDALALLKKRGVSFEATFAGKTHPPLTEQSFKQEIEARGLNDCTLYLGAVYGADKAAILLRADVLALPTTYPNEAFPLVILEAMAYGLAVVATSEGAIADMVRQGESGFLVAPEDSEDLANALQRLLNDSLLCQAMGRKGQMVVNEHFSRQLFHSRMAEIWTKVLLVA